MAWRSEPAALSLVLMTVMTAACAAGIAKPTPSSNTETLVAQAAGKPNTRNREAQRSPDPQARKHAYCTATARHRSVRTADRARPLASSSNLLFILLFTIFLSF